MIIRAPITPIIATAAVVATALFSASPVAWRPINDWLIHTGSSHLLLDVGAWLIIGLWAESRAGVIRYAFWTLVLVVAGIAAHPMLYPDLVHVLGLSAIVYGILVASLVHIAIDRPWAWFILLFVFSRMIAEVFLGTTIPGAMSGIYGFSETGLHVLPVPQLHLALALLGLVLGGASRLKDAPTAAQLVPCCLSWRGSVLGNHGDIAHLQRLRD